MNKFRKNFGMKSSQFRFSQVCFFFFFELSKQKLSTLTSFKFDALSILDFLFFMMSFFFLFPLRYLFFICSYLLLTTFINLKTKYKHKYKCNCTELCCSYLINFTAFTIRLAIILFFQLIIIQMLRKSVLYKPTNNLKPTLNIFKN